MKIEVWSDYVCPFCYIGKRRLEQALESLPERKNIDVIYKSFELDPNAKRETTLTIHEALAKKYGTSLEEAKRMNNSIGQQAAEEGLQFNFDNMKFTNTFDAHRLAKFAATKGKAHEMTERLLLAYFTENKQLSNHNDLITLADELNLDRDEVKTMLEGSHFEEDVRFDEMEARKIGVQGVPFFVFNRKYAISGAQPITVFQETIKKVLKEESEVTFQPIDGTNTCTDEGCDIPKSE
ncbi:DsbA family oxidoreductase [Halalkalibacter krulwichiae]|uniref:DSBA-like thioredoxin domain protein n=1 Tax=Halalkalibacter krulwichiae TaxID=199441 RepID=A0A1X9M848_9BACI|nr:DsbA family oxidoreductase [Halalkalibacter krulwichiae]ARK29577.1 DSBA-like thioredoxin domain protein [Halalkalibacter krulwichiae]